MHRGELVADATAARVQHDPHATTLVDAELEEVVPRAERPELLRGAVSLLGGELGRRLVLGQPTVRVARRPVVAAPHTRGDRVLDPAEQRLERVGELVLRHVELGGDHAAPDVDADGRRDHGARRRDHGADRRALPDVRIGHEGHVTLDDRQAGRLLRLPDRLLVDLARPGDELVVDVRGHRHRQSRVRRLREFTWEGIVLGLLLTRHRILRIVDTSSIAREELPCRSKP